MREECRICKWYIPTQSNLRLFCFFCMFPNVMWEKKLNTYSFLLKQRCFIGQEVTSTFRVMEKSALCAQIVKFLTCRATINACHHLPDIGSISPISLCTFYKITKRWADCPSPFYHQSITQLYPVLNNLVAENDGPFQYGCGWLNALNDDTSESKWPYDTSVKLISLPTNHSVILVTTYDFWVMMRPSAYSTKYGNWF